MIYITYNIFIYDIKVYSRSLNILNERGGDYEKNINRF